MPKQLDKAVVTALARAPVTLRELSRRAGVPHITLSHIRLGQRSASLNAARGLMDALEAIARDAAEEADRIRRALTQTEEENA